MAKCILCHDRQAVLPDRYSMSSRKKVCRECHAKRLQDDMRRIVEFEAKLRRERNSYE